MKRIWATQGKFYDYIKENHHQIVSAMGRKWTPKLWHGNSDSFGKDRYSTGKGWKLFIDSVPKEYKEYIPDLIFDFFTIPVDIDKMLNEIKGKVNNFWNKVVICKRLDTHEEEEMIRIVRMIKSLHQLCSLGELRQDNTERFQNTIHMINLSTVDARDFTYNEIPPVEDKGIFRNSIFPTKDGYWWELDKSFMKDNEGNRVKLYFRAKKVKIVPQMSCAFKDNVFMAIPNNIISKKLSEKFTNLLEDKGEDKKVEKVTTNITMPTEQEIGDMDIWELGEVIDEYNLSFSMDEYDEDSEEDMRDLRRDVITDLKSIASRRKKNVTRDAMR